MEKRVIKKVVAFDFDDTLAKTKSLIGVRLAQDPANTEEYLRRFGICFKSFHDDFWWVDSRNYEKIESSCDDPNTRFQFDYTQTMNIDLRSAKEISPMMELLRQADADPETLPIIVTARAGVVTEFSASKQKQVKSKNRPKILKFLASRGVIIPKENLHTVGDTSGDTSEAKHNILHKYLTQLKLDELIFYDDSERNITAAIRLKDAVPAGCRLSVYQVEDGQCTLRYSYVGLDG